MIRRTVDNRQERAVPGRERRWHLVWHHDEAVVVNYLVLEPGEEISDTPPEVRMSRADWARRHDEFGLAVDGQPAN